MRAFITMLIVLLMTAPVFAADYTKKVPTNKCSTPVSITDGDNWYWDIGYSSNAEAAPVSVFLDHDITDALISDQRLTLYACLTAEDANSCIALQWDSDADGVPDTNVMGASLALTDTGVTGISGFPYLRVEETGTVDTNARYVVCRGF